MAEVLRRQRPSAPWHPPSVSSVPPPPARCRPSGAGCERVPRSPAENVFPAGQKAWKIHGKSGEILWKFYGNTWKYYMEILYIYTIALH